MTYLLPLGAVLLLFLASATIVLLVIGPTILLKPRRRTPEFYRALHLPTAPSELNLPSEEIDVPVSERIGYERILEYHRSTPYTVSAPTEWYLLRGVQAVQHVLPILEKRRWKPFLSPTGSFIGSDNPVVLEGPKDEMIGFKNAEIILYPVSRHLVVYGTVDPRGRIRENRNNIARINTLIMLTADQQVFSHLPDFCWMDENNKYQTDWRLFSKEKIVSSLSE